MTESENDETADAVLHSYEENVMNDGERYRVSSHWKPSVLLHSNKDVAEKRLVQLLKGSSVMKTCYSAIKKYGHENMAEKVNIEESCGVVY